MEVIIQVQANLVSCQVWDDGTFIGEYGVTNGPDAAVLLAPFITFCTRNTTTKQVDIKKVILWSEENRTT